MWSSGSEIVYVGCYTPGGGGRGAGIVAARRDPVSGALEPLGTVATTQSPSFLARHPGLPVLYAVNEIPDGTVTAWTIRPDGGLDPLASRSTGGASPCHLAVPPGGGHLLTANYGTGSVCVHPLDPRTGTPGARTELRVHQGRGTDPDRQEAPHVHMVSPDRGGTGLLVVDLGTDEVRRYELRPDSGRLRPDGVPIRTRPGTGPRHLARHPDGRWCYLAGELDATVGAYEWDGAGVAHERARVPASRETGHAQPSEIAVGPDGRFLYLANRGVGTIGIFEITAGVPRFVTEVASGGPWPRHFALIGSHLYVADERTDRVSVFAVDPASGVPRPAADPFITGSPTCVLPGKP